MQISSCESAANLTSQRHMQNPNAIVWRASQTLAVLDLSLASVQSYVFLRCLSAFVQAVLKAALQIYGCEGNSRVVRALQNAAQAMLKAQRPVQAVLHAVAAAVCSPFKALPKAWFRASSACDSAWEAALVDTSQSAAMQCRTRSQLVTHKRQISAQPSAW